MNDLFDTLERQGIMPSDGTSVQHSYTEHRVVGESSTDNDDILFSISRAEKSLEPRFDVSRESFPNAPATIEEVGKIEAFRLGDRVTVQYLDDPKKPKPITYVISNEPSDETRGVLGISSTLARALIRASIEDEIEYDNHGRQERAIFLAVHEALQAAE